MPAFLALAMGRCTEHPGTLAQHRQLSLLVRRGGHELKITHEVPSETAAHPAGMGLCALSWIWTGNLRSMLWRSAGRRFEDSDWAAVEHSTREPDSEAANDEKVHRGLAKHLAISKLCEDQ